MKISLKLSKQLGGIPDDFTFESGGSELISRINQRLGAVEGSLNLQEHYVGACIIRIVSCQSHPDADRLSVCLIDEGGINKTVARNNDGYIQVVCGAANARVGLITVWLPPGSTVPATVKDKTPFVLDSRKLRGIMSHGMLAAPDELGIGKDHSGIIELPDDLYVGHDFANAVGLDDTTIEIENKMFTHRPDCFGQLGAARELAGIYGRTFTSPPWYSEHVEYEVNSESKVSLSTVNNATEKVPRLMTAVLRDVTVGPSPLWLQIALTRLGSKPINNVVDITNYMMLLTAQPIHAYDYDSLNGGILEARYASKDESITLLNGKVYRLHPADIVIADGRSAVGLAGVMGGKESEVSSHTTTVVLEVATFDMYAIRRTSMRHGLFTDAVTRYNKGQSPRQNSAVLAETIRLFSEITGATLDSKPFDSGYSKPAKSITVTTDHINSRLGLNVTVSEIVTILKNVECVATPENDTLTVVVPFWRTDLEIAEDIIEEVGRLKGFETIPRQLPTRSIQPADRSLKEQTIKRLRDSFSRVGANEILSFSFVPERLLRNANQDPAQAFEISNALSQDLKYYRLSVLPSLLSSIHQNHKAGHNKFVLYEIGKGHNKHYHRDDDHGLPRELEFVDFIYSSRTHTTEVSGAAFYKIRRIMDQLSADFSVEFMYAPANPSMEYTVTAPFDLSRSAMITTKDGLFIGMIGELKPSVCASFKLPDYVAAGTLDFSAFEKLLDRKTPTYRTLSSYPRVERDVCFRTPQTVSFAALQTAIDDACNNQASSDLKITCTPIDIFNAAGSTGQSTNITFRFVIFPMNTTLSAEAASHIIDTLTRRVGDVTGADVV